MCNLFRTSQCQKIMFFFSFPLSVLHRSMCNTSPVIAEGFRENETRWETDFFPGRNGIWNSLVFHPQTYFVRYLRPSSVTFFCLLLLPFCASVWIRENWAKTSQNYVIWARRDENESFWSPFLYPRIIRLGFFLSSNSSGLFGIILLQRTCKQDTTHGFWIMMTKWNGCTPPCGTHLEGYWDFPRS